MPSSGSGPTTSVSKTTRCCGTFVGDAFRVLVPLESPLPHGVRACGWIAFSHCVTVSEEELERILCEIVIYDGKERAIGDIVCSWCDTLDHPMESLRIIRRVIHPEFLQLLVAGACQHIPVWYNLTSNRRGKDIGKCLGITPEKIQRQEEVQ